MKNTDWKSIAELIGIAAIVASLVFVGLQMQQEREIAYVDSYGSLAEERYELSLEVGQNMETWQKGLEGTELDASERGIFLGLLAAVEMHHQRKYIRSREELAPGDPFVQARRFAYALYVFPGMRQAYSQDLKFVNSMDEATGDSMAIRPWKSAVLQSLEKLDQESPALPIQKSYIFWSM